VIAVCVAVFQMASGGRLSSLGGKQAPIVVCACLTVLFVALFGYFQWRFRRFNGQNKAAVELLNAGKLREAGEAFEANAKATGNRLMKAASVYNLAIVKLKLGELGEAASLFGEIERGSFGAAAQFSHHSPGYLSLCMTLDGDLAAAADWLDTARRRTSKPSYYSYVPVLAEAALSCRQGKLAEMDTLAQTKGAEAERGMTGDYSRLFWVFHAFALDGLSSAALSGALAKAAPTSEGEYAFLGVRWPEMAAFLERNRLSKAA
jgi:hypothetical protein